MYTPIINQFINQFKAKHPKDRIEVVGVLGFGSRFNQEKAHANADLDVYIVIKNAGKRYRGVMLVQNIKVDYFAYPLKQLLADWKKVKNKTLPRQTFAYMLRDGKILLDQGNKLKKLKAQAREFLKNELRTSSIPRPLLTLNKYFINDYLEDIEDSLRDKDIFSWQYNANLLLNDLISIFCQFHKIPLVKPKCQSREIAKKDTSFVALYESIAKTPSMRDRTERIKKLAHYCLESLGGPLPNEWELERPVDDV